MGLSLGKVDHAPSCPCPDARNPRLCHMTQRKGLCQTLEGTIPAAWAAPSPRTSPSEQSTCSQQKRDVADGASDGGSRGPASLRSGTRGDVQGPQRGSKRPPADSQRGNRSRSCICSGGRPANTLALPRPLTYGAGRSSACVVSSH